MPGHNIMCCCKVTSTQGMSFIPGDQGFGKYSAWPTDFSIFLDNSGKHTAKPFEVCQFPSPVQSLAAPNLPLS